MALIKIVPRVVGLNPVARATSLAAFRSSVQKLATQVYLREDGEKLNDADLHTLDTVLRTTILAMQRMGRYEERDVNFVRAASSTIEQIRLSGCIWRKRHAVPFDRGFTAVRDLLPTIPSVEISRAYFDITR